MGPYQGVLRELIMRWKYSGMRSLTRPLAALLAEVVDDEGLAAGKVLLTSVPLHPRRRRARGFNQSELLARDLSDRLDRIEGGDEVDV